MLISIFFFQEKTAKQMEARWLNSNLLSFRPAPKAGLPNYLKPVGVAWFKVKKSPACCQVLVKKSMSIILYSIHSCNTCDLLERERTFKSAKEVPEEVGDRECRLRKHTVQHTSWTTVRDVQKEHTGFRVMKRSIAVLSQGPVDITTSGKYTCFTGSYSSRFREAAGVVEPMEPNRSIAQNSWTNLEDQYRGYKRQWETRTANSNAKAVNNCIIK